MAINFTPIDNAAAAVQVALTSYDGAWLTKGANDSALVAAQAAKVSSDSEYISARQSLIDSVTALLALVNAPPPS